MFFFMFDQQKKTIWGIETETRKTRPWRDGRGQPEAGRGPAEAFGARKSQQESATNVSDALRLQAGGGKFKMLRTTCRTQHL